MRMPEDGTEDILQLVDLDRYPVNDLASDRGRAFIRDCQAHMAREGWCSFDGFIRPAAVAALTAEANGLLGHASQLTIRRNIYGGQADADLPESDTRRREYIHRALQLADDQIGAATIVKRLYHCDALTDFIRQVEGKDALYRSGDEFQALNIVALEPGDWHGWHYDYDECVVTLLLQAPEAGGEFVFLPNCRSEDLVDGPEVERFLAGDWSVAKTIGRGAGTLTVFRGEYSLHGVTGIEGDRPRITAIFTYDDSPGRRSTDEINVTIYGDRVRRILEARRTG